MYITSFLAFQLFDFLALCDAKITSLQTRSVAVTMTSASQRLAFDFVLHMNY